MSPRSRKHWTVAGFTSSAGLVLILFQQLAATRQSFVQASGGRDVLAVALSATQDSLAATRDTLKVVRKTERRYRNCCKSRHGGVAPDQVEPAGPPEPVRRGSVRVVLGNLASGVGHAVRWLFGG